MLKPKQGESYRVSFVNLPGLTEGNLSFEKGDGTPSHPSFNEITSMWGGSSVGGRFLVKEPRYANIPGIPPQNNGNPQKPQTKWFTALVLWPTDRKGQVDSNRLQSGDFQVKLYGFTKGKMINLANLSQEYPLSQHDLSISVTDEKHNMTFTPKKESLLKSLSEKKPDIFEEVIRQAQYVMQNQDNEFKDFTYEELVEKFSQTQKIGSPNNNSFKTTFEADDVLDDLLS